ncbi:MAG: SymE family type I addiction module toxin [Bacteroidota bacterium]|nr:SymE family type I addiction module toxin [Bacteroidota bacterium]
MKSSTSQPTGKRRLKIYQKFFSRTYKFVLFPEIRLCGKWLQETGFKTGKIVIVQHVKNKIIITLEEEK